MSTIQSEHHGKVKILHLTYDMRIGGTEMVIKNLVSGIDRTIYEPEILCIEPKLGPFGEQLLTQGIKVTNLHWTGGFDKSLIKSIRQYIKSNKIDVLHCHQYSPWVYGVIAAAFTKTKVIFTEHGRFYPDTSSWKRRVVNPLLMLFTDYVTAISKATKQALTEYEFIPESRVSVIYNGIEPLIVDKERSAQIRSELAIPNDVKVVGTIARLDPIKNQTMMIKAFSESLHEYPNTILLIVGDGEERQRLENLVDELVIRANVIFTGYVAQPTNHLAIMDVFLLSSLSEGTSMTLLEAMSIEKPCVVTDAGGNAEVIIDQSNGLVSPNDNAEKFKESILHLLQNEQSYDLMSKGALEVFSRRFHVNRMNEQISALYQSCVMKG